jgi:hypothetical protein
MTDQIVEQLLGPAGGIFALGLLLGAGLGYGFYHRNILPGKLNAFEAQAEAYRRVERLLEEEDV